MDSANCQTSTVTGELSSEAADVESATSQDGSDDGGKCSPTADTTSAMGSKKGPSSRDESSVSRDSGKKKKSRGSAKLKQSKLDIRREQFLAQVAAKSLKGSGGPGSQQKQDALSRGMMGSMSSEDHCNGPMSCDSTDCGSSQLSSTGTDEDYQADDPLGDNKKRPDDGCTAKQGPNQGGKVNKKKGKSTSSPALLDSKSGNSLSPTVNSGRKGTKGSSKANARNGLSGQHLDTPGVSQSVDTGDLEDDWEAAAEEFSKQVAKVTNGRSPKLPEPSSEVASKTDSAGSSNSSCSGHSAATVAQSKPSEPGAGYSFRPNQQDPNMPSLHPRLCPPTSLRPEYSFSGSAFGRSRSATDRAWRPDDVARPPTLPPAWTHRANARGLLGIPGDLTTWRIPQLAQSHWPAPSAGAAVNQAPCCPICAEEFDTTDSSFVPCSCGFKLCLFCHHRIAADDGRCPGCRRAYSPDAVNRLSKPATQWLRL